MAVNANSRRSNSIDEVIELERRRYSRTAAGVCGIAMSATAVGWLLFCLTTRPGPGATRGAELILPLMSVASLPMLAYARRLLLDAVSDSEIALSEHAMSIVAPRILRSPITLDRALISSVIVDPGAIINADERLRFAIADDATFLYSSIRGSSLPILSLERAVPNVAILFEEPLQFTEPRRRTFGAADFVPLRPLQPGAAVPGLLLRVADPTGASRIFDRWASTALPSRPPNDWTAAPFTSTPALLRPLSWSQTTSRWPSLPLIGAVFGLVYAGRNAALGLGNEAVLLVGFVCLLTGGVIDARLQHQERTGFARILSVGLTATGLMLAAAVLTLSTAYR